ncbi:MAG TPA: ABC transporter permease [Methylomusa anaerophila]|uniref:Putative aliphatic sulfonates transport permease protein SsuC n=1 Tax=Methylomusa anaerophila TaxID=1930071 RepID=A0A348AEW7_9FIRM|nr:ABC transporter permease [Methylomusa anaerophila]BBB89615.1 putative aliphatic sulfonates transport permease protein SsuC [Methylomusa anaerophila]HML89612.1 ABC transporter permease [Methylomusa anaerophila]
MPQKEQSLRAAGMRLQLRPRSLSIVNSLQKVKLMKSVQFVILPVLLLVIWQLLFEIGIIKPVTMPPPTKVARSFLELAGNGQLLKHIGVSILRVLEGFGLAALTGIVLGIGIGLSKVLDRLTDLLIQVVKPIPPIAWIPLAILWFGIGEPSKIYIIFLGAFFPILINVLDGIRQTDSKFIELSRVLEVSKGKFIRQVVIPGALPAVMTGLRVGLGVAWMCVVAAELIAATQGIGYLINDARQLSQPDVVLVGMITIGVIGKVMDDLLKRLETRLIVWKTTYAGD